MLCGKPLIAYTIEAAAEASKLTDWVVSTESPEIAQVANAYGAFVVKRPQELAEDDTTSGAVLRHALDWMEDRNAVYDVVVCLHPTSPIRNPRHIDQAIEMLDMLGGDVVASACRLPSKSHPNIKIGQEWAHTDALILNAAIYAMTRNFLLATGKHIGGLVHTFEMDRRHSMDIDEEIDLKLAELFLAEQ
jgi:CMP-N,N'-diacetyllegionaminic acid synthase